MDIISRTEAARMGFKRYFSGEPCTHGHIAEYFVSSGNCVECQKLRAKQWKQDNEELNNTYKKQWYEKHSGIQNANTVKCYARKRNALPKWANLKAIEQIYVDAFKIGQEVDHILPFDNDLICGLHVEFNLQLLTITENRQKNNHFDPDEHIWKDGKWHFEPKSNQ